MMLYSMCILKTNLKNEDIAKIHCVLNKIRALGHTTEGDRDHRYPCSLGQQLPARVEAARVEAARAGAAQARADCVEANRAEADRMDVARAEVDRIG